MDESIKQELREVLVVWYGPQANNWEMNDEVLNLVIRMMKEMNSCTAAMIWVPEPINFGNALTQLMTSAIKRFVKHLRNVALVFKSCGSRVLLNFKSPIALAGMGL
jgi:hypothetical protein